MVLYVDKKTGFKCYGAVQITHRNTPFYVSDKSTTFNLPIGVYKVVLGRVEELKKPLQYILPPLPKKTRPFNVTPPTPLKFKIEVGYNPNKCTFDLENASVLLDESIAKKGKCYLDFIFGHEIYHLDYLGSKHDANGELYCDMGSAKLLIDKGYNPSQLYFSQNLCLTHSDERKKEFLNYLKKIKVKK